ncbi:HAD family phosphatase [soil metagenome]
MPRSPRAIVFDMDGVLFDTEALYRDALFAAADAAGSAMTDALFLSMIGSPWPANRTRMLDHYGQDFAADALRDDAHRRLALMTRTAGQYLKAGVIDLLDVADAMGLPCAIATSSGRDVVADHLAAHGLEGRFRHVVAHGDYAAGKPAPDPFLTAAARLGIPPGLCVALEDSHNGVRSAAAAGMMTIMVPDLLEATDAIRALCVHVAADLNEVRGILMKASRTA